MSIPGPKRQQRYLAPAATLRCPTHLPDAGKYLWRKLVPLLEQSGHVSELDRPALEALCISYAHLREAAAAIERDGIIIEGARGVPTRHPAVLVFQSAQNALKMWASEFGLSASARSMLPDAETTYDDNLEQLLPELFGNGK